MNNTWRRLADGVCHTRLRFLDVTVGLVWGRAGVLVIDCGTTLSESRGIDADVREITGRAVSHVVLTHHHFDHVLGSSVFTGAAVYGAPEVVAAMSTGVAELRADAVRHGADAADVDEAVAALRVPDRPTRSAVIDLGERRAQVSQPGGGHTDHDLMVVIHPLGRGDPTVVFCGDLVEESGDPVVGEDADLQHWPRSLDRVLAAGGPDAVYVPGHGAAVGADFVRGQRDWVAARLGRRPGSAR